MEIFTIQLSRIPCNYTPFRFSLNPQQPVCKHSLCPSFIKIACFTVMENNGLNSSFVHFNSRKI
jgi:hypothetical protein